MRLAPRRFASRLALAFAGLVSLALGGTTLLTSWLNRGQALAALRENLVRGSERFQAAVDRELSVRAGEARLVAADYALRQTLVAGGDPATFRSLLMSYSDRLGGTWIALFGPDGEYVADSSPADVAADTRAAFTPLLARAQADERDWPRAKGFGSLGGGLYAFVVVPVFAPAPEIAAWLGLGVPIDAAFARELGQAGRLEVSFAVGPETRLVATTLSPAQARDLALPADLPAGLPFTHRLDGDEHLTLVRPLPLVPAGQARLVLQRSLAAELAPTQLLENVLLAATGVAALASILLALALARGLSEPVRRLAAHTRRIARGDYATRLNLDRADEMGDLARALDAMSAGLAERDRVRDLLDKNVSPEVAARLLHLGTTLGGIERTVTILFVDLRGFTALSESLPGRELVALLNRYLEAMSGPIEREGGIIDKFIGDEIMAVFGAPVEQPDAADRALRAALALPPALAALNAELAAEGGPTLRLGIGINTGRVVAGNMGSARRQNFTVVGDEVNVAARVQTLTRDPRFDADILCTAATLAAAQGRYRTRALGEAALRGRAAPVQIHAVDGVLAPGT